MDTLKTAVIVVLLLAVVYGAYVVLNQPDSPLPQEIAWHEQKATEPLQIELGTPSQTPPGGSEPVGTTASPPSWSSDISAGDAKGPNKPFIHAELSPEEPPSAPRLSEPSPIGGVTADANAARPNIAAGLSGNEQSPAVATDKVAAPNLLSGTPADPAKPDANPEASATTSEPAKPTIPTLPDLRQTGDANAGLPDPSTLTANAILPTNETADENPSASSDAVLKASLEKEGVGPITAEDVAKRAPAADSGASASSDLLAAAVQEAQTQIANGKLNQALFILSRFVSSPDLDAQQKAQLFDLVDPLAAKVVYSTEHLIEPAYEVKRGEKLSDIADVYHVPWELLANINSVENPDILLPGTKLKVVPGPFRAEVDLQGSELTLFAGQLYAGRFPISVGNDPQPKPGEYRVMEKQVGRVYYAGDGRTISADDPSNPYGRVWIGLGNDLCIHSSPENSPPNAAGCISLSPLDANDVYGILSQGSSVIIRR